MKILTSVFFVLSLIFASACDRELKEHPIPESLKKELARKNDPAVKASEIAGTILLDKKYAKTVPQAARVFVIARPEGVTQGPPLAVRRFSMVKFPLQYSIGPADVMLEGNKFEGPITLTARLDHDGNAMAGPGDIEGTRTAQAGDKEVVIMMDRMIEPDNNYITGVIRIDPDLASNLPLKWQLFLIARPEGTTGGPPLAVKRLTEISFPHQFTLGQENTMLPGAVFEGKLKITARLDLQGNAKADPGDIEGTVTVKAGDEKVEIVLNNRVGG
ncbi:MAG: hypothetical protein ACE5E9_13960 [Nitrospinaceae bacterium]